MPILWFHLRGSGNALRSESRSATTGRAAQTLKQGFVVAQIALAFVLLAGAGLLGLSLKRAMAIYPGFQPDHVLTAQVSMTGKKYPSASAGLAFIEKLVGELDHQPGVLSAGVVNNVPFSGSNGKSAATVKGYVPPPGEPLRGHYSYGVGGDYFRAMGFRLLAGRFLTGADSRRPRASVRGRQGFRAPLLAAHRSFGPSTLPGIPNQVPIRRHSPSSASSIALNKPG